MYTLSPAEETRLWRVDSTDDVSKIGVSEDTVAKLKAIGISVIEDLVDEYGKIADADLDQSDREKIQAAYRFLSMHV